MPRRNAISSNVYSPNKAKHLEPTISSFIKQREKYVDEVKEMTKMYLSLFNTNFKKVYPSNTLY